MMLRDNNLTWILMLLAAATISSCCQKSNEPGNVLYVPPSTWDYAWFQFPEGLRIFQNQFGVQDTFVSHVFDTVFNSKFVDQSLAYNEYSSCETVVLQGTLSGYLKPLNGQSILLIRSTGRDEYHPGKIRLSVSLKPHVGSAEKFVPSVDTVMTVNNITYSDAEVVDNIVNVSGSISAEHFHRLYYSKSTGLIKYISSNGDVWELTN